MLYLEEKPWELGGKECCGLTSKLVSRTTDDCHPWHSNLCHGQMTTFILSVDRHVILERFREEAPLCQKDGISFFSVMFYLTLPTGVEWSYLSLTIIWNNLPLIQTTPGFFFTWSFRCGCLWAKLDIHCWMKMKRRMPSIEPTNMTGFFMGQRSHMLPKLSCLSN